MLVDKDKPFYSVVQVAEILGISSDRLRTYDEQGLVSPTRRKKDNKRLYSELDIEWLKDLRSVIAKNRMNIYSFKITLNFLNSLSKKQLEDISKKQKDTDIWEIFLRMKSNPNFKKLNK